MGMGSRDKDTPHQNTLSSLVVRPPESEGGVGGGGGGGGAQSDYEPGEVRRDPPPYSRSDGYRTRAGSVSPVRHRNSDHYERSGNLPRNRGFGSRDPGRYRDSSPPHFRGRGGGRPFGRGFDGPGFGSGPSRGENLTRNNPNVRPREGDWYCPDRACNNLNFARRDQCNNCHRPRYGPVGSPRRAYPARGPPPPSLTRHFPGPPIDRSPRRSANGFRSPPRGWARDGPRDFGISGPPHARHEGRFADHHMRRDRQDYLEDDFSGRRPIPPPDLPHRLRGRDMLISDRIGYERQLPSPLPHLAAPMPPARWARERSQSPIRGGPPPPKDWARDRSRSPIRGGLLPPKDYRRDAYMGRGRDDRRDIMRDRVADAY